MERLNHQAELLLKKATQESDKHTVQDPLSELRLLWDSLEDKIISRQVNKLGGGSFINDFGFCEEIFVMHNAYINLHIPFSLEAKKLIYNSIWVVQLIEFLNLF